MLFWITYSLDRNIAFRLGHTPAIQDYDIDTPMVTVHPDLPAGVIDVFAFWVDCGRIQGKICTQLYGPGASSLTSEERIRIAESLAEEMEQTHERKNKVCSCRHICTRVDGSDQSHLGDHGDGSESSAFARPKIRGTLDSRRSYHALQHNVSSAKIISTSEGHH